jgi:hypothetical protein
MANTVRLYHPNHGWGTVVRMSADQNQLFVEFPSDEEGVWIDPAHPQVTLEGAAFLGQIHRQPYQYGYCWNCNQLVPMDPKVYCKARVGWVCPCCGALSAHPHSTCRDFGSACYLHRPVDPDGNVME